MSEPKVYINVPMSAADEKRIEREERTWSGPRLVLLGIVTLLIAFAVLFAMASATSETYWDDWLVPGGVTPELER
jgi:hypothetical protein